MYMRFFAVLAAAALSPHPLLAQQAAVQSFIDIDAPVVALTHARLVDGTGRAAREGHTVVIRDGMIESVGADGAVSVPAGATVIDASGKTLIPGLVMVHEHMFYPAGRGAYTQQEYSFPRLYLAGGATTIRTGGSRDPYGDLNLKRDIDAGLVPGPTIHVTGPYLNAPGLPIRFVNRLEGPDHARRMVAYWADEGVTSYKAYMQISRAELGAAVEEAHARDLHVTGHLCSVTYREAARLGIDNLEHGFFASTDFVPDKEPDRCPSGGARNRALATLDPTGPEARSLIEDLIAQGVALTSTLTVFEISVPGRPRAPDGALAAMSSDARDRYLQTWSRVQAGNPASAERLRIGMAMEREFFRAGGHLVVGIDPTGYGGVVAGYANQRALELLVEAGLTFEETVQAATLNGARLLGIDDRVGSLEVGKTADLVLIGGDPTARVEDVRKMELVFKAGVGYSSERLFASVRGDVGIR